MAYSREYIAALMRRVDIVKVVQSFVQMRKTGGGDYVGLCPFHAERSPSFKIITNRQFYHCHACGATGSAITFLMESQGLTFPSAIGYLAKQCRFYPKEWARNCRRAKQLKQRKRR